MPTASRTSRVWGCRAAKPGCRAPRASSRFILAALTGAGQAADTLEQSAATASALGPPTFAACARPDVARAISAQYADLGGLDHPAHKLPVVYHPCYNIGFWGLEKLHPFDSKKYQHVLHLLEDGGVLSQRQLVDAHEAVHSVLREVHGERYLQRLNTSPFAVAQVTELVPLAFLPSFLLRRKVLRPMATMAGGTMLAAALAMQRGWAINLGGGMHHAAPNEGGGWCPYADITLAWRRLMQASGGQVSRIMVIDLDVHQGNGVERCKLEAQDGAEVYIVDVYNAQIYPRDTVAKTAINARRELPVGTEDGTYLEAVASALQQAFQEFPDPHVILYNAGTDVLQGDPLGRMQVSMEGVLQRDEMVWAAALQHEVPIAMVLSGGYTPASTPCIAGSIRNLFERFDLARV